MLAELMYSSVEIAARRTRSWSGRLTGISIVSSHSPSGEKRRTHPPSQKRDPQAAFAVDGHAVREAVAPPNCSQTRLFEAAPAASMSKA